MEIAMANSPAPNIVFQPFAGERRKDQVCMVYENPLDFMALMESVERNGVYPVMARRYHIILNGRKGIREACEYLKANPDCLEVRCFMSATEDGARLFTAINDRLHKSHEVERILIHHAHLVFPPFAKYSHSRPTVLKYAALCLQRKTERVCSPQ